MKKIFPLFLAPLLLLSGCAQKETSSAQNNTVGDMTIALDTLGETPTFAEGTIDGQPMELSFKEFELLTYFMENQGIRARFVRARRGPISSCKTASLSARTAATLFPFPLSAKAVTAACR